MFTEYKNNIWALLGMSVVIAAMIVAWWAVTAGLSERGTGSLPVSASDSGRGSGLAMTSTGQADEIKALYDMLAGLGTTAERLKDSVTYLEAKLIRAHVLTDNLIENGETLAATRVEAAVTQSAIESLTESKVDHAASKTTGEITEDMKLAEVVTAVKSRTPDNSSAGGETGIVKPVAAIQTHERQSDSSVSTTLAGADNNQAGTWAVNLASFSTRQQAENFMTNVGMKGFGASLQQVTVKGKEYWRVQIAGLATREEAKSQGSVIKQRLELKEVWVTRR